MRIETAIWTSAAGWTVSADGPGLDTDLVLFFAAPGLLDDGTRFAELRRRYPRAALLGCSSGGEIVGNEVLDGSVVAAAVGFAHTSPTTAGVNIAEGGDSRNAGIDLGTALAQAKPKAVLVLSDGTRVNGSDLVLGLRQALGDAVVITGGLAADGADFRTTRVGLNENPAPGRIAAVAFSGDAVRVGHGSIGGWDEFGPERTITRSAGNVLYELDGHPVLDLYKTYLSAAEIAALPGSALLFPLQVRAAADRQGAVVRTVLGVNEAEKSMTFAGDVPQGHVAQLMRGNFDRLIQGAEQAAADANLNGSGLAVLISCIGRKLLMGQRVADEVEAAAEALAPAQTIGFYSYGEISPHSFTQVCELHNQTMTITTIIEDE